MEVFKVINIKKGSFIEARDKNLLLTNSFKTVLSTPYYYFLYLQF